MSFGLAFMSDSGCNSKR